MFCKNCGKQIDDDSKFCQFCGKNIINEVVNSTELKPTEPNNELVDPLVAKYVAQEKQKIAVAIEEPVTPEAKKKKRIKIIIAVTAVVLIFAGVFTGMGFSFYSNMYDTTVEDFDYYVKFFVNGDKVSVTVKTLVETKDFAYNINFSSSNMFDTYSLEIKTKTTKAGEEITETYALSTILSKLSKKELYNVKLSKVSGLKQNKFKGKKSTPYNYHEKTDKLWTFSVNDNSEHFVRGRVEKVSPLSFRFYFTPRVPVQFTELKADAVIKNVSGFGGVGINSIICSKTFNNFNLPTKTYLANIESFIELAFDRYDFNSDLYSDCVFEVGKLTFQTYYYIPESK